MSNSIHGNSDSQPSLSWPRRLAILACLTVGCVFSFRAVTSDVAAKVTSENSSVAEIQASIDLTVPVDGDVKLVTKNIEDIQAGDLVLARDEHGSAIGLKPVKETYQRVSHHLRHLTFETPDGTQQTLSTTDEHPFWSVTAEEFVEAGSLIVGHSVVGPTGETQTLVSSAREEFPDGVPVFNFQVTDYHTYFVAASADKPAMLVHNAEYDDVVDLWKAPSGARPQSQILDELQNGFKSANYPGNGPYFATDKSIAEAFQGHYGNGLQQIRIPKAKYDELVAKGVIQPDGYYSSGSVHVPANLLDAFNEALKQGPANVLH